MHRAPEPLPFYSRSAGSETHRSGGARRSLLKTPRRVNSSQDRFGGLAKKGGGDIVGAREPAVSRRTESRPAGGSAYTLFLVDLYVFCDVHFGGERFHTLSLYLSSLCFKHYYNISVILMVIYSDRVVFRRKV